MIRNLPGRRRPGTLVLVLASISVLMLLPACNSGRGGPDVWAKVNGRKILRSEVEKYYANQTAGARSRR